MDRVLSPSCPVPEWLERATELKEVVLDKLESTPEARRLMPGEWSACGVVEHLILLEENVAGAWRNRLLEAPPPKPGMKAALATRMIVFVASKTHMRVPTLAVLEPMGMMGVEELTDRWRTAREALVAALPEDMHRAWVLHPALGPLSGEQMGRLIAAHLEYHIRRWPVPPS